MTASTNILMVCMGNICRSPMAQAVAQSQASGLGLLNVKIDSAGTHGHAHAGEPPDPRARAALQRREIPLPRHRARRITSRDFERHDLIVAMDRYNLGALREVCPPGVEHKLVLLLDFVPARRGQDIPDPYFGDMAGFERVLDLCEDGVRGLLEALRNGQLPVRDAV